MQDSLPPQWAWLMSSTRSLPVFIPAPHQRSSIPTDRQANRAGGEKECYKFLLPKIFATLHFRALWEFFAFLYYFFLGNVSVYVEPAWTLVTSYRKDDCVGVGVFRHNCLFCHSRPWVTVTGNLQVRNVSCKIQSLLWGRVVIIWLHDMSRDYMKLDGGT